MATVTESSVWESGIYRIETTDPILGGENGTANTQAKQLANRTKYLKTRADQVDAAKGPYADLQSRMDAIETEAEALGPDMQDAQLAALKFAIDQSALANYTAKALREQLQQEGEVTILNRGVVSGCTLVKSTTAARNLSVDAGVAFASGRTYPVGAATNAASVPANTGGGSVTVYAYLYPHADGGYRLAVTAIGQAVPANGITIYNVTIPANSTDATDPNLASVTLTSVRRIEALFPQALDAPVDTYIAINQLAASDYRVDMDVVSAVGAPCRSNDVAAVSRATNGLILRLASAADDVVVRWRVSRLKN